MLIFKPGYIYVKKHITFRNQKNVHVKYIVILLYLRALCERVFLFYYHLVGGTMKKFLSIVLCGTLLFALFGCGSSQQNAVVQTTESMQTETATTEIVDDTINQHYPVTISNYDYSGKQIEQTFDKAPEKVLAVYQSSIETMLALGLEDHILASYGLDNAVKEEWKAGFEKAHYNADVFAPDKETVIAMEPDFIFSWGSLFGEEKLGDVYYWQESGVHTYLNSNTNSADFARTLQNEYDDILNIGKIFDVEDKAQSLVTDMQNQIQETIEKTKNTEAPSVVILEFLTDTRNYGSRSLGGDMVTQLGGKLALPDANSVGKEDLVNLNPDIIFVVYMPYEGDDPETVKQENLNKLLNDPALSSLNAINNDRVYPIMLSNMYASGPRTADGIRTFANGLYPEIELQ